MKKKWWDIILVLAVLGGYVCGAGGYPGLQEFRLNEGVKNLYFLTNLEKEVVEELNLARTNPAAYAEYIEDFKKYYVGNYIQVAGQTRILTQEGVPAVNEAIAELESANPAPPLRVSKGLSQAAKAHVDDQGPGGLVGHNGSDQSTPEVRMNRFGKIEITYGEVIEYGNWTARRIVIGLIVDDGVPDRSHRKNIFNSRFRVVGVSFGSHKSFSYMCVIDFAGAYVEKSR